MRTDRDGRLAWVYVDQDDLRQTGAVPSDTEGLVNQCLTLAKSEAAFIAVQLPNGHIKFSLRCRPPHNVAAVAETMQGGGHVLAAGATLEGPLSDAIERMRAGFCRMLDAQPVTADSG